jgi:hypothetical protein
MARNDRVDTGWYEVEGGYVCVSRGAILTRHLTREMRARLPVAPRRDAGMPYRYGEASAEAVMYRALPALIEEQATEPERFRAPEDLAAERASASQMGTPPPPPRMLEDLAGIEGTPVLRRLARGMFVSLDRAMRAESDALFWRTQRGGFVRVNALGGVGGSTFRGLRLDARTQLPVAFVTAPDAATYRINARGAAVRGARAPRLSLVPLTGSAPVTVRGEVYLALRGGTHVMQRHVTVVEAHTPPDDLRPGEKWIDVNLDRQSLVAYEGNRAVFATLVSTGIPGRAETDASYETVQGGFRIRHKHLSTTMDGNSTTGAYSIEDVPWVMYFEESFALHGAFWHSGFGRVRSHRCVNLSTDDARWLFEWTDPVLPQGWHAVFSAADEPGTRVYVHHENQSLGEHGGPVTIPTH